MFNGKRLYLVHLTFSTLACLCEKGSPIPQNESREGRMYAGARLPFSLSSYSVSELGMLSAFRVDLL